MEMLSNFQASVFSFFENNPEWAGVVVVVFFMIAIWYIRFLNRKYDYSWFNSELIKTCIALVVVAAAFALGSGKERAINDSGMLPEVKFALGIGAALLLWAIFGNIRRTNFFHGPVLTMTHIIMSPLVVFFVLKLLNFLLG